MAEVNKVDNVAKASIAKINDVPVANIEAINQTPWTALPQPFVMEIDSTNLTAQTITLGLTGTGSYNFDVNWGDGSAVQTITSPTDPNRTHVYSASQRYTITLQPNTPTGLVEYGFGDNYSTNNEHDAYIEIISWGSMSISFGTVNMFRDCSFLNWNTATAGIPQFKSKVSTGSNFFRDCDSLTADLSGWGTAGSPITGTMVRFYFLSRPGVTNAFNANFVANPSNLEGAFSSADYNNPLSNYDTSGVSNFSSAFTSNSIFNQDISMWDTSSAINMSSMFNGASSFNQNLPNWSVSSVTNMSSMFLSASAFNGTLTNWTTTSLVLVTQMFQQAINFNQPLDHFDVSNVTSFNFMFYVASSFNQDLNSWNTASATSFYRMFRNASVFNGNISSWNTSSVTNFRGMFRSSVSFTGNWGASGNIGSWNTSSATNFRDMFSNALNMTADLRNWDVSSVSDFNGMFSNATSTSFVLNLWRLYSATNLTNFASGAVFTDQQCEDAFVAWSNDPLTATNVNATNIWGSRTYPIGGAMQTATIKLTGATYNWTVTGLTFV